MEYLLSLVEGTGNGKPPIMVGLMAPKKLFLSLFGIQHNEKGENFMRCMQQMYHWKQCSVGDNVKLEKWISYGRIAFSSLHDSSKQPSLIVLGKRKKLPTCAWHFQRTVHVSLWHAITTCKVICLPALLFFSFVKHGYGYGPTFYDFP